MQYPWLLWLASFPAAPTHSSSHSSISSHLSIHIAHYRCRGWRALLRYGGLDEVTEFGPEVRELMSEWLGKREEEFGERGQVKPEARYV